jgi:hypothetical protein
MKAARSRTIKKNMKFSIDTGFWQLDPGSPASQRYGRPATSTRIALTQAEIGTQLRECWADRVMMAKKLLDEDRYRKCQGE